MTSSSNKAVAGSNDVGVSVVLPVYNEAECIESTVRELIPALDGLGRRYEVVAVDDGSTDATPSILLRLKAEFSALRVIALTPNSGQSAAFQAGFRHARGRHIVTMDADGQNDPAEIPRLLEGLAGSDCCCGYRAKRQDTFSKRVGSRIGNGIRNWALGEAIVDTGCSLKAFKREWVQDLALWHGLHRFLPSLCLMKGAVVTQIPVRHRPRLSGTSKYTNFGRLRKTIWDLMAVRWMKARYRRFTAREVE
jgi:glycosyltransferase involved in cell wall biosynthesis